MKTSPIILLICALSVQLCQSNPLLALKIARHSWEVLKFARNFIESSNKIDKISNQIENINKEFKNYINDVRETLDQIEQALQNISTQIRKELRWHEIREHITDINNAYEDLIKYKSNVKFEAFTITDFAKNAISFQPTSIKSRLNFLHSYLIDKKGTVFMSNIKDLWKAQESWEYVHQYRQSEQSFYNDVITIMAFTETKAELILRFSYDYLQVNEATNYAREINYLYMESKQRFCDYKKIYKETLANKDRLYWFDNGIYYKEGQTYEQITRLIQGFVQNQETLTSGLCIKSCNALQVSKTNINPSKCEKRSCKGKVIDCKFLDRSFHICPSPQHSLRRYDFIESENKNLGNLRTCSQNKCFVESYKKWFLKCDYCICLCDEADKLSDRYFSLHKITSDISQNKIVTGIKIVKKHKLIHLMIEQGILTSNITVFNKTWKALDEFKITDRKIHPQKDYHTLTFDSRTIDLDHLQTDPECVVTGVGFTLIDGHLKLQMRQTKFNIITGKLNKHFSKWKINKIQSSELKLESPDIPIKAPRRRNKIKTDVYIKFTNTDLQKDVAQTTVPFLDSQPVTTSSPIQGVGLYHKGVEEFGGFIAPLIYTYDYSLLIKEFDDTCPN